MNIDESEVGLRELVRPLSRMLLQPVISMPTHHDKGIGSIDVTNLPLFRIGLDAIGILGIVGGQALFPEMQENSKLYWAEIVFGSAIALNLADLIASKIK